LAHDKNITSTPESINEYCAACSVSGGFSWCQTEGKCVRPWELAALRNIANTRESFNTYCSSGVVAPAKVKIGGSTDNEHGCIAGAGYIWCETEGKCVRPWELSKSKGLENTREGVQQYCSSTPAQQHIATRIGGETDQHGCVAGAGYVWCSKEAKCIRPWELAKEKNFDNSPSAITQYCSSANRIGSTDSNGCIAGAGYTWCANENKCVRPWELAREKNIAVSPNAFQKYCEEESVSKVNTGASDNHGCIAGAGYTWCANENKCVRPWELATLRNIDNTLEAFTAYCGTN